MGLQDYISESEAAARAGVSTRTLQRFAEAGYLHVEVEPDGLRLYSRSELDDIFASQTQPPQVTSEPFGEVPQACSAKATPASSAEPAQVQTAQTTASSYERNEGTEATNARQEAEHTAAPASPSPSSSADDELRRLRQLLETQETILSMRDAQLKDLKEQRDWLQTRVERLEEKSDRDQILLLSETQTIRKLISMQEQKKKSAFRSLLEWVGLLPPEAQTTTALLGTATAPMGSSATIEVRKAANGV